MPINSRVKKYTSRHERPLKMYFPANHLFLGIYQRQDTPKWGSKPRKIKTWDSRNENIIWQSIWDLQDDNQGSDQDESHAVGSASQPAQTKSRQKALGEAFKTGWYSFH